ncbi:MAG: hypothetical protein JXQ71_00900 [Verrucomicrobia bacterium]|nr:hypothetical protein [Verrucomicrobiota bacterium]
MKIFFDQGTPLPLRRHLHPHEVDSAAERGWSTLQNGELLDQAEGAGYEAFITPDQHLRHQQHLVGRRIRVMVLMTTSWPRMQRRVGEMRTMLERLAEGGYVEGTF